MSAAPASASFAGAIRRALRGGRAALGAVALLYLSSCDNDQNGPGGASARVHGIVRDASSGKRMRGVRVEFTSDTLDRFDGKSDDDGEYQLYVDSRTPHGKLEASKKGYAPRVLSVYLDESEVALDVELAPE